MSSVSSLARRRALEVMERSPFNIRNSVRDLEHYYRWQAAGMPEQLAAAGRI